MKTVAVYALTFILGGASWATWESWRNRNVEIVRVPKGYTLDGQPLPPGAKLVTAAAPATLPADFFTRPDVLRQHIDELRKRVDALEARPKGQGQYRLSDIQK